jgi:hypothetical protein
MDISPKAEAKTFIDADLFSGQSNESILYGHSAPRATEEKIYNWPRARSRRVYSAAKPGWRIQRKTFTPVVRTWQDLDSRVPLPIRTSVRPDLRDVYVVSLAHGTNQTLTQSVHHWSVYCNGLVYHLGANSLPTADVQSSSRRKVQLVTTTKVTRLRVDKCTDYEHGPPLVCYHIGQTDLLDGEIKTLAEWIISHLPQYSFFTSNCQHFVMALCVRILCRRRFFSVFSGSLAQLHAWDTQIRARTDSEFVSSFLNGFQLCPLHGYSFLRYCTSHSLRAEWYRCYYLTDYSLIWVDLSRARNL